ncbi:sensor histidine kinase [Limnovirga soli]|uniref:GHKL domain-containing protein n=1 Tax=Limnovirga soli TaxID=2656915 RepID=A0A8J8JSN8_9BACT|nr:histidine kinase [Limnovirga soli]NNV54275.1 GHKL domain-containing protein [Limnovirga soli]
MKPVWYNKKWVVVLLHTITWAVIFTLPFLMRTSSNDPHKPPPNDGFIMFYMVTSCIWIGFFYLNSLVLFPRFLTKHKYWVYIILQLLLLFVISVINNIFFNLLVRHSPYSIPNFFVYNTFPYLFILAGSTAYRMILDKIQSDKLMQDKENENLKTELLFLRSQVSPHFMFNVLNNMVALARKQSDQLEPSLIKLSSLMRYMLYETDEDMVPLEKETEYLQSYIDLQQQRFGNKVCVNASLKELDGTYDIEPMLLIPFVENAFKHGTGLVENAQIDIELRAKNDMLYFTVRNKFNPSAEEEKDKTSGIGLTNVERRLSLLYGKNHTLLINKNDGWFTISLQLNLH